MYAKFVKWDITSTHLLYHLDAYHAFQELIQYQTLVLYVYHANLAHITHNPKQHLVFYVNPENTYQAHPIQFALNVPRELIKVKMEVAHVSIVQVEHTVLF